MLPRRYVNPPDHWRLGLKVANSSQGIVCSKFIFVAGQVDLNERTEVQHPGDLQAQATAAMAYFGRVLSGAGAHMAALVKLPVFYVSNGSVDEDDLLRHLAGCLGPLPGPG